MKIGDTYIKLRKSNPVVRIRFYSWTRIRPFLKMKKKYVRKNISQHIHTILVTSPVLGCGFTA